jgi:hypothetical protein
VYEKVALSPRAIKAEKVAKKTFGKKKLSKENFSNAFFPFTPFHTYISATTFFYLFNI